MDSECVYAVIQKSKDRDCTMSKELQRSHESLKAEDNLNAVTFLENIDEFRVAMQSAAKSAANFLQQHAPAIRGFLNDLVFIAKEIVEQANKWQHETKVTVAWLAENGWFPNWYTFNYSDFEQYKTIDDFMIHQIDSSWEGLTEKILELSPQRAHILKMAFQLHKEENYIASIPLLLAQSDGICSEEFTHFFSKDALTGRRASDEIIHQAENNELVVNFISEVLLEPFKVDLQLSKGSSRHSKADKAKGPNRHGILHGSRKHLDYGSKVNGYKAFSFLAFIVYTTKDQFKKVR